MDPLTMALMGGTSLVSGGLGFMGASKQAEASKQASNAQLYAQMMALQQQQQQYNTTRADLAPYRDTGAYGANMLTQRLPELTSPIMMDQASLEKTPGYQFNLAQGLKATQSAAAARGLGVSGAALKGASSYATGLADSTYQNQFNNANVNQTNAFNRLYQTAGLGQSAASGTALINQQNANAQSGIMGNMGNAQAQGILGPAAATNQGYGAISGGLNNLTQMAYMNNLFKGQQGQNMYGNNMSDAQWNAASNALYG